MVLGITGKYCAGKSAVSEVFAAWGWHIIDVDRLGHHALIEKRDEVLQRFGRELDDGAGGIDRKRLGAIVFRNRTALRYLESIVHPSMVAMVDHELAEIGTVTEAVEADRAAAGTERAAAGGEKPKVAINAALLYPMGLAERCDRVIWVYAGFLARFRRARRRDGIGLLEMLRREHAQKRIRPQFYRVDVDIVTVTNNGDRTTLERRLHEIVDS